MARLPRLYLPDCAHYIIQRGDNREVCFYDDTDYKAHLSFPLCLPNQCCLDGHLLQ